MESVALVARLGRKILGYDESTGSLSSSNLVLTDSTIEENENAGRQTDLRKD